jgi:S-adenosylhomocysteine hydrolase
MTCWNPEIRNHMGPNHMPVLAALREQFIRDQPLKGRKVGMALHVEAKTAVLVKHSRLPEPRWPSQDAIP